MMNVTSVEIMGRFLNVVLGDDFDTQRWYIVVDVRDKRYMLRRIEQRFTHQGTWYSAPIPGLVRDENRGDFTLGITVNPVIGFLTKDALYPDTQEYGYHIQLLETAEIVIERELGIDGLADTLNAKALYYKLKGNMRFSQTDKQDITYCPEVDAELEAARSYYQDL